MEGLIVPDPENSGPGDNKMKGGKIANGSVSTSRKRLADISNLQQRRPKPAIEQVKQQFDSLTNREYVNNLLKENKTLMKLLADRNKIIELSRVELQNLRINLQKVQEQNVQLAQANNQILGELNSGKDRLKALQHELGCKNGLLKVRKLEAEERVKRVACQHTENQGGSTKCVEAGKSLQADKEDEPCNTKREQEPKNLPAGNPTVEAVQVKEKADNKRRLRRQSARFKTEDREATEELYETNSSKFPVSPVSDNVIHETGSTCSLVEKEDPTIEALQPKEKADNKRRLTRQSERLKSEEREATEELFDTNGYKFPVFPVSDNVVHESGPECSSVKKEDEGNTAPRSEGQECRRSSVRPSRRAAEKIKSYKEASIKVKMRRDF